MANELTTNQTGELVLAMEQHAISTPLWPARLTSATLPSWRRSKSATSSPSFARTTNLTATRSSSSRQTRRSSDTSPRRTTSSLPACWTPARCWLPGSRGSRRKEALPKYRSGSTWWISKKKATSEVIYPNLGLFWPISRKPQFSTPNLVNC